MQQLRDLVEAKAISPWVFASNELRFSLADLEAYVKKFDGDVENFQKRLASVMKKQSTEEVSEAS